MALEDAVAAHYARPDLEARLLAILAEHGVDTGSLRPADLAAVDEFHVGGREASEALAALLPAGAERHLLDIGSGIGGPARFFAERLGCRVTGLDLTPDFVATARGLTAKVGLAERVEFRVGSALALPFPEASFDAASLLHVGMNIADKARLMAEAARVLRPGGSFALYEVMRVGPGQVIYPVPWASDPDSSFPEAPEVYRRALEAAGFRVTHERERRAFGLDFFKRQRARAEAGKAGPNLAPIMGESFKDKIANLVSAMAAGTLAPVELLAVKQG